MWIVCTGSSQGATPLARFASAPAEVVWGTSPRAAPHTHAILLPSTFTGRILIVHVSLLCEDMGRELTGVTPKQNVDSPFRAEGEVAPISTAKRGSPALCASHVPSATH
jgi:hypothetical protein